MLGGNGKEKQNIWCFHLNRLGEKWKMEFIQPYKKGKGLSIMIWAAIWGGAHSEITILDCDFSNLRGKDTLRTPISRFWMIISILYGNLACNLCKIMLRFIQPRRSRVGFESNAISVMEWPPYTPDLNPIKNA